MASMAYQNNMSFKNSPPLKLDADGNINTPINEAEERTTVIPERKNVEVEKPSALKNTVDNVKVVNDIFQPLQKAHINALPTPGGIALLLLIIIFILSIFVPAGPNGETRIVLLWDALTGNANWGNHASGGNTHKKITTAGIKLPNGQTAPGAVYK